MANLVYDPSGNAVRSLTEVDAWLGPDAEEVLEPDLPIVDPHHHLWRRDDSVYMAPEFLADIGGGHDIRATVFIECGAGYRTDGPPELRCVGETEFVVAATAEARAASRTGLCAGIVGYADLRLGDGVKAVLEAHIAAGAGRFRGIRHSLRWDASGIGLRGRREPAGLALDPAFRSGFAHLAPLGLTFEAWTFHPQLMELADLARAFPRTTFIVNHVGGPLGTGPYAGWRSEVFAHWRAGVAELARLPNVLMKVGGLGMLYYGFDFYQRPTGPDSAALAAAWRPYVEECLARFGPDRCMLESNFPVDKQTCSYRVLWNAFKRLTAGLSADERDQLFRRTAARAYRIPLT
ncbi:MAG: amidohydrolase [Alphaproteobacteria bacterium]